MSRLVLLAASILVGTLGVAQADVYRWVDDKGEPHYSDQWVPGSTVIRTNKPRVGDSSVGTQKSLTAQANRADQMADDQANARAVQADVAKGRDAQCKLARDRYQKAILSRRVYKDAKDGEKEFLSDADADAYREQARKDVQNFCGSVPAFDPNAPIPEPQPIPEPKVNPKDAVSE